MSEEHESSYFVQQGADLFEDDYWNGISASEFAENFDPNFFHANTFDFGAEQNLANAEPIMLEGSNPAAIQSEQGFEFPGVEQEEEVSPNGSSPATITGQVISDTYEAPPNIAPHTSSNIEYVQDWSKAPSYTIGNEHSKPAFDGAYDFAQLLGKGPIDNTPAIDSGYGSAVMSKETTYGMTSQAPHQSDNESLQNDFSAEDSFDQVQVQDNTINVPDQLPFDEDQFWKDEAEILRFQNYTAAGGEPQFKLDFDAEDWKSYESSVIKETMSEDADTDKQRIMKRLEKGKFKGRQYRNHKHSASTYRAPSLRTDLGTFPNYALTSGDDQERVNLNPVPLNSETDSKTHGLILPGDVVGNSGPGEIQRTTGDIHPVADSPVNEVPNTDGECDGGRAEAIPQEPTFETYEELDPLIVQDPRQDKCGRTGRRNGLEVWFNPESSKWQPSATHHDMRETLIARAQAEYPIDRYLHPDKTDGLPHGDTAFFKPHQYRGPHRNDCADALFVWRDFHPKKDADGKTIRNDKPKSVNNTPGFMFEGDKILLDPHNNPVVNHQFIPLTLSTMTDGAKLQEMALHPDCRQVDLWARMPRWEQKKDKNGRFTVQPLREKNTRINMPMTRFREKKGTIAGGDREGSNVIRAGLLSFYHHHDFDPVASGNSTKGFWRDLEPWEVKQVRLGNAASFGARAGDRALDDEARRERYQKMLASIDKGQRKQAAKNGGKAGKRRIEAEGAGSRGLSLGPQKRRRLGQNGDAVSAPAYDQEQGHDDGLIFEDHYATQDNSRHNHQSGSIQASIPPQECFNGYGGPKIHYGLPVQGENSLDRMSGISRTNGISRPSEDTLGPGGRKMHQAPEQTLKKRKHENAAIIETDVDWRDVEATGAGMTASITQNHIESRSPAISDGTQHEQAYDQSKSDPDVGSSHKRHKSNGISETQPRPRRRQQTGRTSRPGYYGAGGAPVPLLPPTEPFGNTLPLSIFKNYAEGSLKPPAKLFGTLPDMPDHVADTPNAKSLLIPLEEVPETTPHTLVFDEETRLQGTDTYHQDGWYNNIGPGEPDPNQGTQVIDTQGGFDLTGLNKNESQGASDVSLAPPQFHLLEANPEIYLPPQVRDEYLVSSQLSFSESNMHTDDPPRVADGQGSDLPQLPLLAEAEQQAHSDIRSVRPTGGWQSQSLDHALRYTREAYLAWTGDDARVTNLEDCYDAQYREIEAAFHKWWRSEENPQRFEPSPELFRMEAWDGEFEDWRALGNLKHLQAPMESWGLAVPDEDGSLQQPNSDNNYQSQGFYSGFDEEQL